MRKMLITASFLILSPLAAAAGPIGTACSDSPRAKGDRGLCNCIQQAADRTLTRAEQRRAARFFSDPDEAQKVRMSKSDRDNQFWARYRAFGELAEAFCAR